MRPRLPPRVVGVYRDRDRVRRVVCEQGRRTSRIFASQEEAERAAAEIASRLNRPYQPRTVEQALQEWGAARLAAGRPKPATIREQQARLRAFLADVLTMNIESLSAARAAALYDRAVQQPTQKSGRPLAAASHRLYLKLAHAFFAWACAQGMIAESPFAAVRPVGDVHKGKVLLSVEDARRFLQAAFAGFDEGRQPLCIGAAAALLLGLRTRDVLGLRVEDVLDQGRTLRSAGTVRGGVRRLPVPDVLVPYLARLSQGRPGEEPLFGRAPGGKPFCRQFMHTLVRRLCVGAGVPVVCTHSLRALYAALGQHAGAVTQAVASTLAVGPSSPESSPAGPAAPPARVESNSSSAVDGAGRSVVPSASAPALAVTQLSAQQIVAALDPHTLAELTRLLRAPVAETSGASRPAGSLKRNSPLR